MANAIDITNPFREVFQALDTRKQRKAMKSAMRKEANLVKKKAQGNMRASGIDTSTGLPKSILTRVYPDKYGLGFMVTVQPHGTRAMHRRRDGKLKPVAFWAETGTRGRNMRGSRKLRFTGKMPAYGFMAKTEREVDGQVENDLFAAFQANVEKAARDNGLI